MREHTTLRSVTNDDLSTVLGGCGKKMQCPQPQPQMIAAPPPPPQQPPPAADGGLDVAVKVAHGAGAAAAMRGDSSAA